MPRYPGIEQYQRRVSAANPIIPQLAPQPSIGEGIADIGAGLRSVGNVEFQRREEDAAVSANSELMSARSHWLTELNERKKNAPPGAENFTPTVLEDFDEDAAERLKRAKTGRAKRELEQRLSAVRLGLQEQALNFEANERVRFRGEQIKTAANDAASAVRVNPYDFPEIAAAQKSAIDNSGLDAAEKAELWAQSKSSMAVSAALGMIANDPRGTIAELQNKDSTVLAIAALDLAQRDKLVEFAKEAEHDKNVGGIVTEYGRDILNGEAALRSFLAREDIGEAEKSAVAKDVQSGIVDLRNSRKRQYVDDMAQIESAISTGIAGNGTIQQAVALYRRGALSPDEYAGYQARIAKSMADKAGDVAVLSELQQGLPLSHHNSDHVKYLSKAFKATVGDLPVGSQPWQIAAMTMAKKHRMMPDRVNDWLNQTSKSNDPAVAGAGAQFYGALLADTPDALRTVASDTKAYLHALNEMIENGTPEKVALETVRRNMVEINPTIVKDRKAVYNNGKDALRLGNKSKLNSHIDDDFDSLFQSQPEAGELLQYDFDAQTEQYFLKTGDIETARQLAWNDLRSVYSPSEVNGPKTMMPVPPEMFGVTAEEVRGEIKAFIEANPPSDGSTHEEIVVVPTSATIRQMGNMLSGSLQTPSYHLMTKSRDLLRGADGLPVVYTLPTGEELTARFKKTEEEAKAEALQKAKAERERRQNTSSQDIGLTPSGFPER